MESTANEEDLKLIMDECEICREDAESKLREHGGNVRQVLLAFVNGGSK